MDEIKRRKLGREERLQIYERCIRRCAYCGCDIEYKDMQIDHVKPLRIGGADDLSNMLPACRSCNHYKATLGLEKFRKYIEDIPNRLNRDSIPFAVGKRFGVVEEHQKHVVFWFEELGIEIEHGKEAQ